jgi:hypothetical protein
MKLAKFSKENKSFYCEGGKLWHLTASLLQVTVISIKSRHKLSGFLFLLILLAGNVYLNVNFSSSAISVI